MRAQKKSHIFIYVLLLINLPNKIIKLRVNNAAESTIMHLKKPNRRFVIVCHISFTNLMLKSFLSAPCREIRKQN